MSKPNQIQPPPIQPNQSPFGDGYVLVGGSLTGLVAFLAFACLFVIWSRSGNEPAKPLAATVAQSTTAQSEPNRGVVQHSRRVQKKFEESNQPAPEQGPAPATNKENAVINDLATPLPTGTTSKNEDTTVADQANSEDESADSIEVEVASASDSVPTAGDDQPTEPETTPTSELAETDAPVSTLPFHESSDYTSRRVPEHELRAFLDTNVKELDIRSMPSTIKQLQEAVDAEKRVHTRMGSRVKQGYTKAQMNEFHPLLELAKTETDLYGLPMRQMGECEIDKKVAPVMSQMSLTLRSAQAGFSRLGNNPQGKYQFASFVSGRKEWRKKDAIPGIMQMLQAEGRIVRLEMIDILKEILGKEASQALAQRAIFDFWGGAREAAVDALSERPPHEYRRKLIEGFRYPWPPIADHAADALVALNDQQAVSDLVDLLDEPNPEAPYQDQDGQWCLDELVRVNHMRNCTLCHAPSFTSTDPIRGLIPVPGQRLPVVYYSSQKGDFVRADVTYIKQDFSAMHEVERAAPWPKLQRFDYFVRKRALEIHEIGGFKNREERGSNSYPQREAVLYALRRLTGDDVGESTAAWRQYHSEYYASR